MSIAELKKTAEQLSARERLWLRCYLTALDRTRAPGWKEKIAAKRRKARGGGGVGPARYRRSVAGKSAAPRA